MNKKLVSVCIPFCLVLSCAQNSLQYESDDAHPENALPYTSSVSQSRESKTEPSQEQGESFSSINPAVQSLLEKAELQENEGNFQASELILERALRIAPREPEVHVRLAEIRLKQGNAYSALQLALKGQSLISQDSYLVKQFWRVIGDSYTALGNMAKASAAYQHL